jgi:hypothetical protein
MKRILIFASLFFISGCVEPVEDWETHLGYDNYWLEYSECRKNESVGSCNDSVYKSDYWRNVGVYDRYLELNTNDASVRVYMECQDLAYGGLQTPMKWYDARDNSSGEIKPYPSLYIVQKYKQKVCNKINTAEEFEKELLKLKNMEESS